MAQTHQVARSQRLPRTFGWQWCLPILGLALLVRLIWLYAPFNYDATTLTACMRAMVRGGIAEVLVAVQDRIHMPLELYLLSVPGWFSQGAAANSPPTLTEMLALRLSMVFTDVLAVAAVYRMGRKAATAAVALVAAALWALWPGGIYVDSWWTQTDIWYVVSIVLGAWWLANEKVELAWLALALGVSVKWQAAMVVPVFLVGTWRWYGWRGLARGLVVGGLTGAVVAARIVLTGQVSQYLDKSTIQVLSSYVSQKAHNFWFAAAPQGRVMWDGSMDVNPWLGGVSFHDAGLVLVALAQTVIVGRLFWRSGPRSVAAASALAVLATTMFATQISTRHYLAVPALFLLAGLFERKWWGFCGLLGATQIVNLIWESGEGSPLRQLLPISNDMAVANAWANLAILAVATALFIWPLFGRRDRQSHAEGPVRAMNPPLEPALLGLGLLVLIVGSGAYLERGRELGQPILAKQTPLVLSLQDALHGVTPDQIPQEKILAINLPWRIGVAKPRWLGVVPITPPALIVDWPYAWPPNVTRVQYLPWQTSAPGTLVEFVGDFVEAKEVYNLLLQADRIVVYRPDLEQMALLSERLPAKASPGCPALFDAGVCLVNAATSRHGPDVRLDLTWEVTGRPERDMTVFVHATSPEGDMLAQADGDLVQNVVPLADWPAQNGLLHEARWLTLPADGYQIWVGLYNRTTGARASLTCSGAARCTETSLQVSASQDP